MPSNFPGSADSFPAAATIHAKKQDGTADPSPPVATYHSDLLGGLGDAIEAIEDALLNGGLSELTLQALPGQTDPLLDLKDEFGADACMVDALGTIVLANRSYGNLTVTTRQDLNGTGPAFVTGGGTNSLLNLIALDETLSDGRFMTMASTGGIVFGSLIEGDVLDLWPNDGTRGVTGLVQALAGAGPHSNVDPPFTAWSSWASNNFSRGSFVVGAHGDISVVTDVGATENPFTVFEPGSATNEIFAIGSGGTATISALPGQTAPLLDLKDEHGTTFLSVSQPADSTDALLTLTTDGDSLDRGKFALSVTKYDGTPSVSHLDDDGGFVFGNVSGSERGTLEINNVGDGPGSAIFKFSDEGFGIFSVFKPGSGYQVVLASHSATDETLQIGVFTGQTADVVACYDENGFKTLGVGPTGALNLREQSDPSSPAANVGRVFVRDNGSNKSQLCVRFPTGAVQVLATEP